MPSQLEMLKEDLPALEAKYGPANPFVQGLKMQIASLEKPRADNPTADLDRLSVGMRAAPSPKAST